MNVIFLRLALFTGLVTCTVAMGDVLDQPVTLKTETDLIRAVSVTLQHAVATSEQYRGTEPRLQRFASKEISARRKPIQQLSKLSRSPLGPVKQLTIASKDGNAYLQAMLRNHAWLIELIEYGAGLPLSPETKRLMEALSRSAASEFATLSKMEKS